MWYLLLLLYTWLQFSWQAEPIVLGPALSLLIYEWKVFIHSTAAIIVSEPHSWMNSLTKGFSVKGGRAESFVRCWVCLQAEPEKHSHISDLARGQYPEEEAERRECFIRSLLRSHPLILSSLWATERWVFLTFTFSFLFISPGDQRSIADPYRH